MTKTLTVPSNLISVRGDGPLTPAMTTVIWRIADALDAMRIHPTEGEAVWLKIPTAELRGEGSRNDNVWLREILRRLRKIELEGAEKDCEWAAQLIAQEVWLDGGRIVHLMLPPAAVAALNAPKTFAKIEEQALIQLPPHARKLYALLADKKRLKKDHWRFDLDHLKRSLGVDDKKSYERFNAFRQRVLDPAMEAINALGTVKVTATPDRQGRRVAGILFEWRWKALGDAADIIKENDRHSQARGKHQATDDAPPMIEDYDNEPALTWWNALSDIEKKDWIGEVGEFLEFDMPGDGGRRRTKRRTKDIIKLAFKKSLDKARS